VDENRSGTRELVLDHELFAQLSAELIQESGGLRFRAHGRSMAPFILDGDELVLERVGDDSLRVGQVVLFRSNAGAVFAHRLLRRELLDGAVRWTTRGDARNVADPSFTAEDVIGRVTHVVRAGRSRRVDRGLMLALGLIWARIQPAWRLALRVRRVLRRIAFRLTSQSPASTH